MVVSSLVKDLVGNRLEYIMLFKLLLFFLVILFYSPTILKIIPGVIPGIVKVKWIFICS